MSLQYNEALKEKYAAHPQVRRISRHRQVPKHLYNAQAELRKIREKNKRKYVQSLDTKFSYFIIFYKKFSKKFLFFRDTNKRCHSKKGTVPFVSERKAHVVGHD